METKTVIGYYGLTTKQNKCIVIVAEKPNYNWYCVKGSQNINKTFDAIEDKVDVETINDVDMFRSDKPINTERQLIKAIES